MGGGAGDHHRSGFERLAERIEHAALKLREFVEEQDAEMGKADFAGPSAGAAADQCRHRGAVMRAAERPGADEPSALQLAGHRRDHRDFQRFGGRQFGQNAGQRRGEQRLARSRGAAH